ncbi:hypothetical protein D3C77_495560 [compost metagenome]
MIAVQVGEILKTLLGDRMKGIEDKALPDFLEKLRYLGAAAFNEISVVPDNITIASNISELAQSAESDTVRTLLTQNQIPHQDLFENDEDIVYIQNYSDDWFGPTILVPIAALIQNPNITSVVLGLITNYLYDAFKGGKDQTVKLSIIKETTAGEFRKVSYDGPIQGMTELADIVNRIE